MQVSEKTQKFIKSEYQGLYLSQLTMYRSKLIDINTLEPSTKRSIHYHLEVKTTEVVMFRVVRHLAKLFPERYKLEYYYTNSDVRSDSWWVFCERYSDKYPWEISVTKNFNYDTLYYSKPAIGYIPGEIYDYGKYRRLINKCKDGGVHMINLDKDEV